MAAFRGAPGSGVIRPMRLNPLAWQTLWLIGCLLEFAAGALSIGNEVLIRVPGTMGIRYCGLFSIGTILGAIFFSGVVMDILTMITQSVPPVIRLFVPVPDLSPLQSRVPVIQVKWFSLYLVAILVMACVHLAAQWRANRPVLARHTYESGETWPSLFSWLSEEIPLLGRRLPIPNNQAVQRCLYEPVLFLGLSYPLGQIDPATGWFVWLCSICMAVRAGLAYIRWRNKILDIPDARLEARMLMEAAKAYTEAKPPAPAPPPAARPSPASQTLAYPSPNAAEISRRMRRDPAFAALFRRAPPPAATP